MPFSNFKGVRFMLAMFRMALLLLLFLQYMPLGILYPIMQCTHLDFSQMNWNKVLDIDMVIKNVCLMFLVLSHSVELHKSCK